MFSMNKLLTETRVQILSMLVEGSSMRSTSRVVGVSINTVAKLLVDAGKACAAYHDEHVRDVEARRVQCDEIWSFCYAKQKNVATAKAAPEDAGDVWTWTALDADSRMIISYLVGGRDSEYAIEFMDDVASRLANRVQLTMDGHKAYLEAVEGAFGGDIDYAQLIKMYGAVPDAIAKGRYSPAECTGSKHPVEGSSRPGRCEHVLRGASEPHHAYVHAPVYPAHECVFKEDRQPHSHAVALLCALQLLPPA